MVNILVAEDELIMLKVLKEELNNMGYFVKTAENGEEASTLCAANKFDIILLDIKMPYKNGLEVLKEIRSVSKEPIVIMITAFASIENAVKAMKLGADDYITKPYDTNELLTKISQYVRAKQHKKPNKPADSGQHGVFLGNNASIEKIRHTITMVKDLNTTVLITGETGTGKSLIAKEIHNNSIRKDFPFIHVDCAAIPENLIESELFGYEKGSFTGAAARKKGKFELADKGTIFLDEIGVMSLHLQAKLLNTLQEKTIDKIGGTQRIPYDARIIAATNENLEKSVENNTFRKDLYYRINVVRIDVVPLRFRKDDIVTLAEVFIERFIKSMNKNIHTIDEEFWKLIVNYDWPGNVRELENVMESAVALCDAEILTGKDLPLRINKDTFKKNYLLDNNIKISLKQQEMLTIMAALEKFDGHREKTAQYLGISRRTLQYKLKKLNIK